MTELSSRQMAILAAPSFPDFDVESDVELDLAAYWEPTGVEGGKGKKRTSGVVCEEFSKKRKIKERRESKRVRVESQQTHDQHRSELLERARGEGGSSTFHDDLAGGKDPSSEPHSTRVVS